MSEQKSASPAASLPKAISWQAFIDVSYLARELKARATWLFTIALQTKSSSGCFPLISFFFRSQIPLHAFKTASCISLVDLGIKLELDAEKKHRNYLSSSSSALGMTRFENAIISWPKLILTSFEFPIALSCVSICRKAGLCRNQPRSCAHVFKIVLVLNTLIETLSRAEEV